jgi:hypothetical protein
MSHIFSQGTKKSTLFVDCYGSLSSLSFESVIRSYVFSKKNFWCDEGVKKTFICKQTIVSNSCEVIKNLFDQRWIFRVINR